MLVALRLEPSALVDVQLRRQPVSCLLAAPLGPHSGVRVRLVAMERLDQQHVLDEHRVEQELPPVPRLTAPRQ